MKYLTFVMIMATMVLLIMTSSNVYAGSSMRSSTGASCESSDFQPWEIHVRLSQDDSTDISYYDSSNNYNNNNKGSQVGLNVSYKFGGAKQIDCNNFARKVEREQEAHTTKLEMQISKLQAQLDKQVNVDASRIKFK